MGYGWDNYPPEQFPPLWKWVAKKIVAKEFCISQIAFEEVERGLPDCTDWMTQQGILICPVSNDVLQEAQRIKTLLGIKNDKYNPHGVNENDVIIVATAKVEEHELISEEKPQLQFPSDPARAKIPAVCGMQQIAVRCLNFLTLIKESKVVFGK